jgi:hypothetical protein
MNINDITGWMGSPLNFGGYTDTLAGVSYPNGIAPDGMDPNAQAQMTMRNMGAGMLANSNRNPMQALGMSYLEAQNQGLNNARQTMVAKEFKNKEEERKAQRAQQEQMLRERSRIAQMISGGQPQQGGSGGDLNTLYEAYSQAQMVGDEDLAQSIKARIDQQQSGIDNANDRSKLALDQAKFQWETGGKVSSEVARDTAGWYIKEGLAQDKASKSAIETVQQAKELLPNIQTGAFAEKITALRSIGQALGVEVDESVLRDTQAYQNFIRNVVIPRLKEVGGNDSNEEMRTLYQASGGDITQSSAALGLTLDYFERLTREKFDANQWARDVMKQNAPGFKPLSLDEVKPKRRAKVIAVE